MFLKNLIYSIFCLAVTTMTFTAKADTHRPPEPAKNASAAADNRQFFGKASSTVTVTPALTSLSETIATLVANGQLQSVEIVGSSSPEGSEAANDRLALARARAMANYLRVNAKLPADLTEISSGGENWPLFRQLTADSPSFPYATEVKEILDRGLDNTATEAALRANSVVWRALNSDIFPLMRTTLVTVAADSTRFTVDTMGQLPAEPKKPAEPEPAPEPAPAPEPEPVVEVVEVVEEPVVEEVVEVIEVVEDEPWSRKLWVKTNAVGWGLAMINAAAELDLAPRWSVTLPVYYSGFNYFTCTRKFRTITVLPEARYWFRPDNNGFFVGAHFGFSFYNYANNGEYRYQDHGARRPAYGGGLSAGYRFNFTRNPRWKMEIALGAGVYGLYYDRFRNVHDTDAGLLVDTRHRTLFCLDTASISFCYSFDLNKKKGGDK